MLLEVQPVEMKLAWFGIGWGEIHQCGGSGKETIPLFWQRTRISWALGIIQPIKVSISTLFD